ncbi:MAG: UDP-N-acetylmuramate--L-alanine ligase [Actinomycetota bacterium]
MTDLDLSRPRRIHLVGIGGSGMNAIAAVLAEMGHTVTGSDLKHSAGIDRARALGIDAAVGHEASQIGDAELLAVSTAIPDHNVEVVAAQEQGLDVLRRAEILAAIAGHKRTVAVAGTHGKTTTSSMLSLILLHAGVDPSFIIGGDLNEIGSGAVWDGDGDLFVVEADESDGTFLELPAAAGIVTNVDPDHLDHYGTFDELVDAFGRFATAIDGPIVAPDLGRGAELDGITSRFGLSEAADVRVVEYRGERTQSHFGLSVRGATSVPVRLPVPGPHNALNAAAAAAMAIELGVEPTVVAEALGRYAGVGRRYEFRGEVDGITFIDDYAHLPAEVSSILATAADGAFDRVICVFQPHRYSRTAAVWRDFAGAFAGADLLVLTDIYAAGEAVQPGITGRLVLRAVLDDDPAQRVAYLPGLADVEAFLDGELRAGDLCLTLGAGDLTLMPDRLLGRRRGEQVGS